MKKYLLGLFVLSLAVAGVFVSYKTTAESVTVMPLSLIHISEPTRPY